MTDTSQASFTRPANTDTSCRRITGLAGVPSYLGIGISKLFSILCVRVLRK